MTDQAHALRQLMQRTSRIARHPGSARDTVSGHACNLTDEATVCPGQSEPTRSCEPVRDAFEERNHNLPAHDLTWLDTRRLADGESGGSGLNLETIVPQHSAQQVAPIRGSEPSGCRTVLLVGGRSGVGTSMLTRELATALLDRQETVIVADSERPDRQCAAAWKIIDGGSRIGPAVENAWAVADCVTLVTTTDARSMTGSYALIKRAWSQGWGLERLAIVVNQAATQCEAERAGKRLLRCCRQFLGFHTQTDPDWIAFDRKRLDGTIPGRTQPSRTLRSGSEGMPRWMAHALMRAGVPWNHPSPVPGVGAGARQAGEG